MRLLIMGPQGVGKGTQAALLAEHYGIPAISTGDIFRYNIKNKTELGLEALKYTDKGELVPDELTNKIVKDRLAMDDAKNGWILDGYPRNASQVKALDAMLEELGTPLDKVVALDADHDVLMQRIAKRAMDIILSASARRSRAVLTTPPRPSPSVWPRTPRKPLRCSTRTRAAASWSPLTASATSTPFRPTSSPR